MLRLIKYLKPYILLIVLTIALLFIQANAELALPEYLSNIVNIGIQQFGVESAVPQAIRQSGMERLLIFMGDQEKALVLNNYILISPDSPSAEMYVSEYPILEEQPIYVLKDTSQAEVMPLYPAMSKALLAVSTIEQLVTDPDNAGVISQITGIDPFKVPAGEDVFNLLASLPAEQRTLFIEALNDRFAALGENAIRQMAVGSVQEEYRALGFNINQLQTEYILRTGAIMLLISLLAGVCAIAVGFLASRTASGAARDIREAEFIKVESFSSAEFDNFSTASLITRSTNDITQVQRVIFMTMRMVFYAPIIGIGAIIRATEMSTNMWWIIAVAVFSLLCMVLIIFSVTLPKFQKMQNLIDRLNLVTREFLSGMMVIRAFNKQDDEGRRFDIANRDLTDTSLFVARVMVTMMPVVMLLMNILSVIIIWVGAHQVAQSTMQVGDMMAFLQYTMQIVFAFLMMSMMFIFLPRAAVSGGRIADVLETSITVTDPKEPVQLKDDFNGEIEFRNVTFRYPGALEDVIHNISFSARPAETTAIIGSTGCGKSTVVNLIPRFYDVSDGAIYIDGTDIRAVKQSDLRDKIGYIPQKGTLFSGTIESNLRFADQNASMEELEEAVEIAQASEFVYSRAEGFDAGISQGGANVSGGQKQRLAIARALVKKSPVYIFDDSFSALDFKTDTALRKALRKRVAKSTVLIVTQRVATIINADQIIVLDEGRVVGQGKHQELMDTCKTYQEIALSQLSKGELL